jgi:hypothetical protein
MYNKLTSINWTKSAVNRAALVDWSTPQPPGDQFPKSSLPVGALSNPKSPGSPVRDNWNDTFKNWRGVQLLGAKDKTSAQLRASPAEVQK